MIASSSSAQTFGSGILGKDTDISQEDFGCREKEPSPKPTE